MKLILLCACLVFTQASLPDGAVDNKGLSNDCERRIKIESQFTDVVNGTPRLDLMRVMELVLKIHLLKVEYGHKQLSIAELIKIERNEKHTPELKKALQRAIAQFIEFSEPYLKDNRSFKRQMFGLISDWANQRNKTDSLLLEWGNAASGQEYEPLKKSIKTFKEFDKFAGDLSCFLGDILRSCKRSTDDFIEQAQKDAKIKKYALGMFKVLNLNEELTKLKGSKGQDEL